MPPVSAVQCACKMEIVFFFLIFIQLAEATYKMEVMFRSYSNPGSLESSGSDCDSWPLCSICKCDNTFRFCLRPYTDSHSTDANDCSLGGSLLTGVFYESDNMSFIDVTDLGNAVSNPVLFTGDSWPGQFLLYIQVREIDTGIFAANTHVNDFFISMQLPLDSSFTPPQSINGDFNDGSIELGFRVQCDAGFIGDDCTIKTGCESGLDPDWSVDWPYTPPSTNVTEEPCPGGSGSTGSVSRYCDDDGNWNAVDVLSCRSSQFLNLGQAASDLSTAVPAQLLRDARRVSLRFSQATSNRESPLFPADLQITTTALDQLINILEEHPSSEIIFENIGSIFSNVLDDVNIAGWEGLQDQLRDQSAFILNITERFGLVLARSEDALTTPQRFSRQNIAISARRYNESFPVNNEGLNFPTAEDLANFLFDFEPVMVHVPLEVVQEKLQSQVGGLPVVHILFNNLEKFLPTTLPGSEDVPRESSKVYSIQVGDMNVTRQPSQELEQNPLSITFTFKEFENVTGYTCAFWNFSKPVGNGGYSTFGVSTDSNIVTDQDNGTTTVQCLTRHTTSFAVLVDVAGGLQGISRHERIALDVISYLGCAISIVCLTATVIFFLLQKKKLFKSPSYFVHLNLSLTLLVAVVIFIFGAELGKSTTGVCLFLAMLLHYLFLSSFCWMLCEGIMLYLLLVVVFGTISKKWWLFLLIGYLTPLPIVVVSVAIRYKFYGVRNSDEELEYCWLSTEKGTIFAFVAPMLVIILVNAVFLVLGLHSVWKDRTKRAARTSSTDKEENTNFATAKALLKASIILLPLLGLTWVFGLLTINVNSTVFAWLFTIFNSTQGVCIFFFHVIRNEKVWGYIGPRITSTKKRLFCSKSCFRLNNHSSESGTISASNLTTATLTKEGTLPKGEKTNTSKAKSVPSKTSKDEKKKKKGKVEKANKKTEKKSKEVFRNSGNIKSA